MNKKTTKILSTGLLLAFIAVLIMGVLGIYQIHINDNPVKWFKPHHPIRVADRELNKLIGGTYISYLVIEGKSEDDIKRLWKIIFLF